jgi:N-formylglutamate amidohydrolase
MIADTQRAFERHGPAQPHSPVVVSIPHAGRDYPQELSRLTRLTPEQLLPLEDRYADLLADRLDAQGHTVLIARSPRVWIDLNRDEADMDPAMFYPPLRLSHPLSAKARGGLGLIPRRTAILGEIWGHPLTRQDVERRLTTIHRPYHDAVAAALDAAARRFGSAILIDLHSMPPLTPTGDGKTPQIVIGDRFGRSCHGRFSARAAWLAESVGLNAGFNTPYAGGYVLDRHGKPAQGRNAIQIEIDRTLYLAPDLCNPGQGLGAMQDFVASIARALSDEILAANLPIAAE